MECAALTGISPDIIKELKQGKARTLELHSTHNVITLNGIDPGANVFVTSINVEDLGGGDPGIIAEVIGISITMKRLIGYSPGVLYEERERMSARVQLKYCSSSTIKSVISVVPFNPIIVDAMKNCTYHAG